MMQSTQQESKKEAKTMVTKTKFHALFGPYLKVALEAEFPAGTKLEDIRISGKVTDEDIKQGNLVHASRDGKLKVYTPAMSDADMSFGGSVEGKLTFDQWVDEGLVEEYRLIFRWKVQPRIRVLFGRFGEKLSFGFNSDNQFISLDYMSRAERFVPLYILVSDQKTREEMFLCLESETRGELTIREVELAEVPTVLQ